MKIKSLILVLLIAMFSFTSYAETIVLKNGKSVEGRMVERTEKYIKINILDVPITYYFEEIDSINGEKIIPVTVKKEIEVKKEDFQIKDKPDFEPQIMKKIETLSLSELAKAQEYFQKGMNYYKEKQYDEAIAEFKKALEINPNFAEGFYVLGYTYCSIGSNQEALTYFQNAIKIAPNYTDAYNGMAYALSVLGRYDESIDYYKKTLQIDENNLGALNGLGYAYASTGKSDEAVSYFKQAIKANFEYAPAYSGLGVLYYSLGKLAEAKENFIRAKELLEKEKDTDGVKAVEEYLSKFP